MSQCSNRALVKAFVAPEARAVGVRWNGPKALDAGFDLAARDDVVLAPAKVTLVSTGIHLAIPEGWVGLIRDRSSIALKGVITLAGVIDAAYRGEVKIAMFNLTTEPIQFTCGERIAQCVIVPHLRGEQTEVVSLLTELGETERGAGGFGSTGR